MEVKINVVYCFFIASTNAFSIWPPFFETVEVMKDVHYSLPLPPPNDLPNVDSKDNSLSINNSLEVNAEPASSVLSRLKYMLDSPYEDAKGYAVEKAKELVSNLEHNTSRIIQFTLNGANLLVDLGIKGSPTRLRNLKEGKSIIEYLQEMFTWFISTIKSFFITEQNDKVSKDHKEVVNDKIEDPVDSINKPESIALGTLAKADGEERTSANEVPKNHSAKHESIIDHEDSNHSSPNQRDSVHLPEAEKNFALKASNDITFNPPKELSSEEKGDVENARQQIIIIENTIRELEDKMKLQRASDNDKKRLKELKNQVEMKMKFIKISTSERVK